MQCNLMKPKTIKDYANAPSYYFPEYKMLLVISFKIQFW